LGGGVNVVSNCGCSTPLTKIFQSTLLTAKAFGTVARFVRTKLFVSRFALTTWMKCHTVFAGVQSLPEQAGSGPGFVATTYACRPLLVVLSIAAGTKAGATDATAALSTAASANLRAFSGPFFIVLAPF